MKAKATLSACIAAVLLQTAYASEAVPAKPTPQAASASAPQFQIVGVYRVRRKPEPVVIVEARVTGFSGSIDMSEFQQNDPILGPGSAQVAYLEQLLNESGTSGRLSSYKPVQVQGGVRLAFFLHYPQFNKPLKTPLGEVSLPAATARPSRLRFMHYEAPD